MMTMPSKRAEYIALTSLILSVVFFGIAFFVGRWSQYFAVYSVSWLILSATLIWFVLVIHFHTRSLAEQEKLDMSHLAEGKEDTKIFQAKEEHSDLFAVAQQRLVFFEKWFLPFFSAVIAVYQTGLGLYLFKAVSADTEVEPAQPLICAISMTSIAFVCFLISRYATGMSTQPQWKPLRAGGSIFLGTAVLCFALAIGLAMAQFKMFVVVNVISFVIPSLLVILGVETALNVVMDIYRPRLKNQYSRSAFDSRLLGIINEPGGILHTAASAIDYQFGFEVSQTWFYKLLEKAIMPLILFAAVTLYLFSCIVVVNPNEGAIIEHFGNPLKDSGETRIVGPGLTFKWPWPVDIAYKHPTKMISEISIGFVPKVYEEGAAREPLLWGKGHYAQEYDLLVASEYTGDLGGQAVPISLVRAAVPIQYRIKDLYSFIYNHKEPEKLLESICYRELTRFAASATIEAAETGQSDEDSNESLLGAGRIQAKKILTERIQKAADEEGLGVEIVFLGLQGIHPPPDVTADYQKVVGAVQIKQAIILEAQAARNGILSALVGSVEDANELYHLAVQYQQAEEKNDHDKMKELGSALDTAFVEAGGDIFKTLREAQSYAFEKSKLAKATGQRFASQLQAYAAAKEIYMHEQKLAVFENIPDSIRKYVIVAEPNDTQVTIIDLQEKLTPDLYDIVGLEESSEK
ncbi:MAG: SPFH domain-containing protein [Planctomycetota bacterium]|jgi:regulator of protease activity HflC (stomatin/prohibitin superfamily)